MTQFRIGLIGFGIIFGFFLNLFLVPQIMSPRPPVFNGADIAENWEWRSMAIHEHSWWLYEAFPDARVSHVGFIPPASAPGGLNVGMIWEKWITHYFSIEVDSSEPPLDLADRDLQSVIIPHHKVYSRIHCRTDQNMVDEDGCYYFVAWSPDLLDSRSPQFVGVVTNRQKDREEMGLVEIRLLHDLLNGELQDIQSIEESGVSK